MKEQNQRDISAVMEKVLNQGWENVGPTHHAATIVLCDSSPRT